MSEQVKVLEKKVEDLQKDLQEYSGNSSKIKEAIHNFKEEHKLINNRMNQVSGAIQAFTESIKLLKEGQAKSGEVVEIGKTNSL